MATATKKPRTKSKENIEATDALPSLGISQVDQNIVGPEAIIKASDLTNSRAQEVDEDSQYNKIESEAETAMTAAPDVIKIEPVDIPHVRKVAVKKIDRFAFKLGLERTKEKYKMMPGTGHTWAPAKKGNEFITGLEELPEKRRELEKALRVDLSPTSMYWATLTFKMEDKEHGQILNFDDKVMGPFYEVVYYAMLADELIANGLHEYKTGKKPFAEWYIENKEAEAEMNMAAMTAEIEATNQFPSLSYAKRHDIAKLLGLPVWGVTERVASQELWNFIKANTDNAIAFNKLVALGATELVVRVLVKTAIKMNVIRRNRTNEYVFGAEVLGPTEDHIVVRLSIPTNATLRLAIERQLKAK